MAFGKHRYASYTDQKKKRHYFRWVGLGFFIFYATYIALSTLLFSTRVQESEAMQPELRLGDRFIVSSYILPSLISPEWLTHSLPFSRGNVVLVDHGIDNSPGVVSRVLDQAMRFFTLQRMGFIHKEPAYLKRLIGLPGDEITMTNYVLRIKPKGESYTFTEFELADKTYDVTIPQVPALWDASIPFSGNRETIVLGEDECFVLSDDRSNTNDSRTWGPVPVKHIAGKVLFRYWPFTRFGRP
ncbi:MAG: signal peptidase I [Spirochaetaceae bacterium]|jgi:signal peptidase I|nr:signal peptidase I [Spirochaetaceae bacterium]